MSRSAYCTIIASIASAFLLGAAGLIYLFLFCLRVGGALGWIAFVVSMMLGPLLLVNGLFRLCDWAGRRLYP